MHDRFRKVVTETNTDLRKTATKIQRQENKLHALKRKVQISREDMKKVKQDASDRHKSLKARYTD